MTRGSGFGATKIRSVSMASASRDARTIFKKSADYARCGILAANAFTQYNFSGGEICNG
jgi:NAD+--asparagine ADP-ribosyltransferase